MAPIRQEDRLTLAAIARLEEKVEGLVKDVEAHELEDDRRFDRVLDAIEQRRTADDSQRLEALAEARAEQRDVEKASQSFRRQVWLVLLSSIVSFCLGLFAMWLTR